jgi:hypothetical protein
MLDFFKKRTLKLLFIFILVNLSITDTKGQDEEQLAEAAQNPVGDLISIPFQNNTSFGIGTHSRTQNVLNIQPVYPFHINEKWNVITRLIIPIISQPDVSMESGGTTGIVKNEVVYDDYLHPIPEDQAENVAKLIAKNPAIAELLRRVGGFDV